jgi:hypothetical protein
MSAAIRPTFGIAVASRVKDPDRVSAMSIRTTRRAILSRLITRDLRYRILLMPPAK